MPVGSFENVAFGGRDKYLTGCPQISFFRSVYRRHTNFAIETVENTFTQIPQFGKRTSVKIPRYGDLLSQIYLYVTLPALEDNSKYYIYGVGNALIKQIDLVIGGQLIDRHYADWLNIWGELTTPPEQLMGYDKQVGNQYNTNTGETKLYIPLRFWFNRHLGLVLPFIALQFHDISLDIEFNTAEFISRNELVSATTTLNAKLYSDYIFLDSDERRMLAQHRYEILIEQVQHQSQLIPSGTLNYSIDLNFNHLGKELFWVINSSNTDDVSLPYGTFDYSLNGSGSEHSFTTCKLQLNGYDRIYPRYADYFYLVENKHHTHQPRTDKVHKTYVGDSFTLSTNRYRNFIYTYSFAIKPEILQPSGFCNYSTMDNIKLVFTFPTTNYNFTLHVYTTNYNILIIDCGMCGLKYSS